MLWWPRVGLGTTVRIAIEAPGRANRTLVGPLTASLSSARFLAGDNGPGSSVSSDTEEDTLPANKCKKVWSCYRVPPGWVGPCAWTSVVSLLGMTDPASCRAGQQNVLSHTRVQKGALSGRPTVLGGSLCLESMVPVGSQLHVCHSLPDPLPGPCLCRRSWWGLSSRLTSTSCT